MGTVDGDRNSMDYPTGQAVPLRCGDYYDMARGDTENQAGAAAGQSHRLCPRHAVPHDGAQVALQRCPILRIGAASIAYRVGNVHEPKETLIDLNR